MQNIREYLRPGGFYRRKKAGSAIFYGKIGRVLTGIFIVFSVVQAQAQEALPAPDNPAGMSWPEAWQNGRLLLQIRPRYAYITESMKPQATDVWTMRSTLGWQSAPYRDMRFTAEVIHNDMLGSRVNVDPGKSVASAYPLLPDSRYTGVNRLYVDYSGMEATRIRAGRQILRIDNQRFISDVDFRQIPQLFDGVSWVNSSFQGTEILLGDYRRIRNPLGNTVHTRLNVFRVAHNPLPDHMVAAYVIRQRYPAGGATGNSNQIVGLRAEGAIRRAGFDWLYTLEYARQQNAAGGDARIKAGYLRAGAGIAHPHWGMRYDYEVKGSNAGVYGFQTPLTDYYAYNGWALQYTTTPLRGLRDAWLTLRAMTGKLDVFTEYHHFHTDAGRQFLAREADLGFSYTLRRDLLLKLQMARYRFAEGASSRNNVNKTWLSATYEY